MDYNGLQRYSTVRNPQVFVRFLISASLFVQSFQSMTVLYSWFNYTVKGLPGHLATCHRLSMPLFKCKIEPAVQSYY